LLIFAFAAAARCSTITRYPLLRLHGGASASTVESGTATTVTTESVLPRVEDALGEGLKRLYFLGTRDPASVARAGGRGAYEFSEDESRRFVQIVRVMRHIALLFTLSGVLQGVKATQLMLAKGNSQLYHIADSAWQLSYAYLILSTSIAFEAIAETSGRDLDHLMTAVASLQELWLNLRWPLSLQVVLLGAQVLLR